MAGMIRLLLGLALSTVAVAAVPQTPMTVPVDHAARAKFPHSDSALVDKLAYVNSFVNGVIVGVSDREHYGVIDLWVQFPPDGKGDCEDVALTKLGLLTNAGVVTVADYKIVTLMVHRKEGDFGHAILAVRLPDGAVAYLDSLYPEPMTRKELRARGYQFFDWRA